MAAELLNGRALMGGSPQLTIAQPISDTQILGLMAAMMHGMTPEDAVKRASKILEESIFETRELAKRVKARAQGQS